MAKVVVIGGTRFIGRHAVERLLEARHSVTLLNRGKSAPGLFRDLSLIRADRESPELESVAELRRDWDAVLDLCAYYPRDVARITAILKGRVGRYVLCSSLSAYAVTASPGPIPMIDESSPLLPCSEAEGVDRTLATYGKRKAECERVAMSQQDGGGIPAVIIRPSLVYGAHDYTERFAWWIWRASRNEPFILPDDGLTVVARTYAPDLARAFVSAITTEAASGNAYNIAETDPPSFRNALALIGKHLGTEPLERAVSVPGVELLKAGAKPWTDFPAWLPRMNLILDTFRSRRDLGSVSTPAETALALAADAFLAENREPNC